MSEDPYLVQAVLIHFYIFRVNVKNFIRKVSHWAEVVHVLKDHVRWVIIQTKAITGNVIEHAFPNPRADGQVFATGPLICRKKHGAIFDPHLNTFFFSQADDGLPCFQESWPVVVDAFRPVPANECIHPRQSEF